MKNKLILLFLLITAGLTSLSVDAQQLAFPGAEGFGRYAPGARSVANPEIYHVTNLNDSGTGSLRDAVSKSGRIVIFDVSGEIKLKSRLIFSSDSYIAGQTAPGDGIIIHENGASFSAANNLIVRYLRFYMGKEKGPTGKDAAGIANGKNMIFDHLSVTWGLDENFSVNWDSKGSEPADITIQNSIIGQGIMSHSAGGLIQTDGGVSIIGCLYIDNKTRNPKVKGLNQFINNVVYNWGGSDGYILGGSTGSSWAWLEGNYFISGPESSGPFTRATTTFQLYHNNDFVDTDKDGILNGRVTTNSDYGSAGFVNSRSAFTNIPKSHPDIAGGILSPQDALNRVIASAGASLPARTAVDTYMIDQLLSYGKEGKLIVHERENDIYNYIGIISDGAKPLDSDGDGMPDWWEDQNGLNKNSSADALTLASNGYLNIENYINSIQAPVAPYVRCASNIKMDARTKTSVQLSWKNNSSDSDQILLQQSKDGTNFSTVATLPGNTTSHDVTGLDVETSYYYRLISKKTGLADSTPSEILKTSSAGEPKVPYQSQTPIPAIDGTSRFYTSVDFSWENETGPWAGNVTYDLYIGSSPDNLTKVAEGLTDRSFTLRNGNLEMNKTYYWRVDGTNSLGTVAGIVWKFKTGSYSFTTSLVDIGRDFDGTSPSTAKTGTIISASKSYTINSGTIDEMVISGSGSNIMNVNSSNGVYQTSGNYSFFYLSDDSYYIQGKLTEKSGEKNIATLKVNGTSASLSDGAVAIVLFSDAVGFNTSSIIGYEEVELPEVRNGNSGVTLSAPIGTKSFRIYKKVTISTVGEDVYQIGSGTNTQVLSGSGSPRIAYVGATLELVSNDDSENKSPDNTIKSATINGKNAIIDNEQRTITYEFIKGTVLGEWPVTFTLNTSLAKADFVSGNKHNFANGPLLIEVTAQDESKAVYTVTVTISNKTTVGILTATGNAASYDNLLLSAFSSYNVQFLDASATTPADISLFYQNCDLLVLHASVAGTNPIALATKAMVGVKPILNMKAYFYSNGRWNWGTPSNTEIGRRSSNVSTTLQNHPIFADVTFDNEKLELFSEATTVVNAFQYVTTPLNGSEWTSQMNAACNTLATIDGDATKVNIQELNLDNSAKYLMIGLSNEGDSYTRFNTNAVNMLKNAASYLLDPNVHYNYGLANGINDNEANSNINYSDGWINNPDREDIKVFNSMGICILTSRENLIDAQHLHSGLYILKAKTKTIRFIK